MCTVQLNYSSFMPILNKADLLNLFTHNCMPETVSKEHKINNQTSPFTSLTAVALTQQRHRLPGRGLFLSACSGSSCSDWLKMPLLPLVLLLAAGVLSSAEAQSPFSKLPDSYKKGVELAEININAHKGVQHHILFFKTIQQSQIEVSVSCLSFLSDCFLRDLTSLLFSSLLFSSFIKNGE